MSKLNKSISLSLLLPIFILNFSIGVSNSCQASNATEEMTCCSVLLTATELIGENLTAHSCACQITDRAKTPIPLAAVSHFVYHDFKDIAKNLAKNCSSNNFDLGSPFFAANYEFLFQAKFATNLKIYDLLSSYLI